MDVTTQVSYLRKEHQDFFQFVQGWEAALDRLESVDNRDRLEALQELRGMQDTLSTIRDHCDAEERGFEIPYGAFVPQAQLEKLRAERREIARLIEDLLAELRFATLDQTEGIPPGGRQLASSLRRHILDEEEFLGLVQGRLDAEAQEALLLRYTVSPE